MKKANDIKYFAYCRKSSEDSQRQVASIGDQISNLNELIKRDGLCLTHKPFTEEKSAKAPGRPIFNEVLDRIEKGEANALLCWDIDRLYRNPVDEGRLRWLLQNGIIQVIRTPYRQFYPEDAGLLMGVEGGRATDYVIRLSKNVKRGLNSKAARGWRPTNAPIGYIHTKTDEGNIIAPDPERFAIIRKMWDLLLTGTYSVSKIREIAINEWGLRTLKRRKIGGKAPTMSWMYKIFSEPFYYGYFPWKDSKEDEERMIRGKHQPMITEAEFWRAQTLLGRKGRPRPKTHEFAFTGLLKCGECGANITAEEKHQMICPVCKNKFSYPNKHACPKCKTEISEMKNPKILKYTYYHCIKKPKKDCSQKSIKLEDLEDQFKAELQRITIDQDYLDVALEYLRDRQSNFGQEESAIRLSLESAFDSCQTRLKNLHQEYTSPQNSNHELYRPEEFSKLKAEIIAERDGLEKRLNQIKNNLDHTLEATERTFNFCAFALHHFNTPDLQKKKAIFSTIGSNLIIKDQKLVIEKLLPFILIENELAVQKRLLDKFEPKKLRSNKQKEAASSASFSSWHGIVSDVRMIIQQSNDYIYIPSFSQIIEGLQPRAGIIIARTN